MPVLGNNRRFAHVQGRVHHLATSVDHTPFQADSHFEDFRTAPGAPPYHMDLGEILHKAPSGNYCSNASSFGLIV
jgi:hypothetical protein